jgi:tetratricopeptide (TPR) repeat protein
MKPISKPSRQQLFEQLNVALDEIPLDQIGAYSAVYYYLIEEDEPPATATNLEKVSRYLESCYFLNDVHDWINIKKILSVELVLTGNEALGIQLGNWGYYYEQIGIYQKVLGKLDSLFDAHCCKVIGSAYRTLEKFERASEYYHRALELFKDTSEKAQCGWIWLERGVLKADQACDKDAIDCYQNALNVFIENEDEKGKCAALSNIARAEGNLGNLDMSIERFRDILAIYPNSQDEEYAWILLSLGHALADRGLTVDYIEARSLIKNSKYVFEKLNIRTGIAWCQVNLGVLEFYEDNFDEASNYIFDAIDCFHELSISVGKAWSLHNLGRVDVKNNKLARAAKSFLEALSLFFDINKHGYASTLEQIAILECLSYGFHPFFCKYLLDQAAILRNEISIKRNTYDNLEYSNFYRRIEGYNSIQKEPLTRDIVNQHVIQYLDCYQFSASNRIEWLKNWHRELNLPYTVIHNSN